MRANKHSLINNKVISKRKLNTELTHTNQQKHKSTHNKQNHKIKNKNIRANKQWIYKARKHAFNNDNKKKKENMFGYPLRTTHTNRTKQ